MPFKSDALVKCKQVIRDLYKEKPYLEFYGKNNVVEYFRDIVPVLWERLDEYERTVFVEMITLELTGTYNDMYYGIKKIYDALILHRLDPQYLIGEIFNEAKGFSGIVG
jgi:hypothetical protein